MEVFIKKHACKKSLIAEPIDYPIFLQPNDCLNMLVNCSYTKFSMKPTKFKYMDFFLF